MAIWGLVRVLATDGEFHSFRRQMARWVEAGEAILSTVSADKLTATAQASDFDLIFASHVLFNSGAIITEQIFRVNGLGQLLITGVQAADLPLVQTLTFIFAFLIVAFNLIADLLYGVLDPRIRYD